MASNKKPSPVYKLPDGVTLEGMNFIALDHVVGITEATVVFDNGREASIQVDKRLVSNNTAKAGADFDKDAHDKKVVNSIRAREVSYLVTELENWLWYKNQKTD